MIIKSLLILFFITFPIQVMAKHCFTNQFFNKYVKVAKTHNATVGYGLTVLDSHTGSVKCTELWNPNLPIYPASSIKVFVVAAALKMIDQGKLKFNQLISITQSNANNDCGGPCGKWFFGAQRPLKELLAATIIESNNITTNQLMDLVSKDYINELAQEYGTSQTIIRRKVYASVNPEPEILERNQTTVQDLMNFYKELHFNERNILKEELRSYFLTLLKSTKHNNRLNRFFKEDHDFFHKTGSTSRSAADAGYLVIGNDVIIIAGLQESPKKVAGDRWDFRQLALIGREIVNAISRFSKY